MALATPFVDYLVLGDPPHLRARECLICRARYFDRRNACANCGTGEFSDVRIAGRGRVETFTIVSVATPGVPVPFVAAMIDCAGTSVRGNIVNCPADPEHIYLGMPVRLTTYSLGRDTAGVEAIAYAFEPDEGERR